MVCQIDVVSATVVAPLPPLTAAPPQLHWCYLVSELGRYTYRHTAGLLNGEEWRFVPVKEAVRMWPVVFSVDFASSIATGEIEARYGFEASTRARLDAPAVRLRLRRS